MLDLTLRLVVFIELVVFWIYLMAFLLIFRHQNRLDLLYLGVILLLAFFITFLFCFSLLLII